MKAAALNVTVEFAVARTAAVRTALNVNNMMLYKKVEVQTQPVVWRLVVWWGGWCR